MNLTTTKVVVAILFGCLRFIFGILPIKLYACLKYWEKEEEEGATFISEKRYRQVKFYIALFQSFSGGVLFATCFLHMMPQVWQTVQNLKNYKEIELHFPYSQMIICAGFFIVYFTEELCHWLISISNSDCCSRRRSKRTVTPVEEKVSPKVNGYITDTDSPKKEKIPPKVNGYIIDDNSPKKEIKEEVEPDFELEREDSFENEELQTAKELGKVIDGQKKTREQILRCIFVVLALSFHSIIEGLAIGLQTSIPDIWYLFTAVSIHSTTILFCISMDLLIAKTRIRTIVVHVLVLSSTSPLGVFIGLLITLTTDMNTQAKSVAIIFLEGFSAGTILYITFFEVLKREKERRTNRLKRAVFILAGYTLMAILDYAEIYN